MMHVSMSCSLCQLTYSVNWRNVTPNKIGSVMQSHDRAGETSPHSEGVRLYDSTRRFSAAPCACRMPAQPTARELAHFWSIAYPQWSPPRTRDSVTLGQIIDAYLPEAADDLTAECLKYRQLYLGELRDDLGDRIVRNLTPLDLRNWFKSKRSRFKSGSTVDAIRAIIQRR